MTKTSIPPWFGLTVLAAYGVIGYALAQHVSTLDAVAITLAFATLIGAIRTPTTWAEIMGSDTSGTERGGE